MIPIKGLSKAAVLAALYNSSKPLGMGYLEFTPGNMTEAEAGDVLASLPPHNQDLYIDYLKGRVLKVRLGVDELDPWLYDRDNGQGAAAAALAPLLKP